MSKSKLKITLKRSLIGQTEKVCRVAHSLGLHKSQRSVEHVATPIIQGMLRKVSHLVTIEEVQ